jgi:hypothetical protein
MSFSPESGLMKPNPFVSLKNFTVPFCMFLNINYN